MPQVQVDGAFNLFDVVGAEEDGHLAGRADDVGEVGDHDPAWKRPSWLPSIRGSPWPGLAARVVCRRLGVPA
ncbi:hypothetical protein AB0F17_35050 [Nonomuraea sp. NPDC026600]|uniref:hypothetical protein n=1 Tax=Nonomuraea sp. NPDC026600 TaxID=3155363 RepID=UPI0033FB6B5C